MSLSGEQREDLLRLCSALMDGVISEEDHARLDRWIVDSPDARRFYLEQADLSADLHLFAAEREPAGSVDIMRGRRPASLRPWMRAAAALLFLLVLSAVLIKLIPEGSKRVERGEHPQSALRAASADAPVAVLVEARDAVWDREDLQGASAVPLRAGWLSLKSGSAVIRFNSGAMVSLVGPADIRLLNGRHGYLEAGSLVATVPEEAIGFKIDSPAMQLVDLGTSFRVNVNAKGETDVEVLEGEVEVSGAEGRMKLVKNAGRRFHTHGPSTRLNPDAFASTAVVERDARQRIGMYTFDTNGSGSAGDPWATDPSPKQIGPRDVLFHDFVHRGVEPGPFEFRENFHRWAFKQWRPEYQAGKYYVGFKVEARDGGLIGPRQLSLELSRARSGGHQPQEAPQDGVLRVSSDGFESFTRYVLMEEYRSLSARYLSFDLSELPPAGEYEFRFLFKGPSKARAIRLDEVTIDVGLQP